MGKSKYSKEQLEPLIKEAFSYRSVLSKLGLKDAGGNHSYIKSLVIKFGIDNSHFRGKGANFGKFHKGTRKLKFEEILVFDRLGGRREQAKYLRIALIASGVEEKCEQCGLIPIWNNKPIVLQVDHRDGNGLNNLKENLRFLCPNCHSQTESYGAKNKGSIVIKPTIQVKQTIPKPSEINPNWHHQPRPNTRKVKRPSKEELEKLLWEKPTSQLAIDFGVSDNAIAKWAKTYRINKPPRGFWALQKLK